MTLPKTFRSNNFFWAEPRVFKVEWVANFRISKSWFFSFYLKILQQIKGFIPSFLTKHLEQPVSVHMHKKLGELGQIDRVTDFFVDEVKFCDFRNRDFRRFGKNFDFCGTGPILGDWPHFFCCPIIAYILGSYHALPLNPDLWVDSYSN